MIYASICNTNTKDRGAVLKRFLSIFRIDFALNLGEKIVLEITENVSFDWIFPLEIAEHIVYIVCNLVPPYK